jgi:hypothetical protein
MTRLFQRLGQRLTYANVTASLALFLAVGGTGYAATRLPRDSVASPQIVNRSILSGDLAPSAKPRVIEIYLADPSRESYATVNRRPAGSAVTVTRGAPTPGIWDVKVKARRGEICAPAALVRRSSLDVTFDIAPLGTGGSPLIEDAFSISTRRPDGTTGIDVPFYLSVICLPS